MRLRKYTVASTLFVLSLAFNAWVYGSLALEAHVGTALTSPSAQATPLLLQAYVALGQPLMARVGGASGQYVADAAFGDAYPSMVAQPSAAGSLLFSRSLGPLRGLLIILYWATPVLLVLTLLTWALRSRDTHLMGRDRR